MEKHLNEILKEAVGSMNRGRSFVLATVVVGAENTPGRSGFKLICYEDGSFTGTVGGGKLERLVLDH